MNYYLKIFQKKDKKGKGQQSCGAKKSNYIAALNYPQEILHYHSA